MHCFVAIVTDRFPYCTFNFLSSLNYLNDIVIQILLWY